MRIAHYFPSLIAVVCLAAVLFPVRSFAQTSRRRYRRSSNKHHGHDWYQNQNFVSADSTLSDAGRYLNMRDNLQLLRHHSGEDGGRDVDCCPSVLEMVQPVAGKNQHDMYVELYSDGNSTQRFYEVSCHKDVVNKPCRFMDRKLHNQSRCVQKYSFTYALVRDPNTGHMHDRQRHQRSHLAGFPATGFAGSTWMLDYIRVRSGCSCVVTPKAKKKRTKPNHSTKRPKLKKATRSDDNGLT